MNFFRSQCIDLLIAWLPRASDVLNLALVTHVTLRSFPRWCRQLEQRCQQHFGQAFCALLQKHGASAGGSSLLHVLESETWKPQHLNLFVPVPDITFTTLSANHTNYSDRVAAVLPILEDLTHTNKYLGACCNMLRYGSDCDVICISVRMDDASMYFRDVPTEIYTYTRTQQSHASISFRVKILHVLVTTREKIAFACARTPFDFLTSSFNGQKLTVRDAYALRTRTSAYNLHESSFSCTWDDIGRRVEIAKHMSLYHDRGYIIHHALVPVTSCGIQLHMLMWGECALLPLIDKSCVHDVDHLMGGFNDSLVIFKRFVPMLSMYVKRMHTDTHFYKELVKLTTPLLRKRRLSRDELVRSVRPCL
jgi:hypothetical protein